MVSGIPFADTLGATRSTPLYEWTFAIVVANVVIHFYRLVAQFATFMSDLFKLSYGVDLFWPLTTDDLRPYTHYFTSQNEIIYKLAESLILLLTSYYGMVWLLDNSSIGLIFFLFVFFIHSSLLIVGVILLNGKSSKFDSG